MKQYYINYILNKSQNWCVSLNTTFTGSVGVVLYIDPSSIEMPLNCVRISNSKKWGSLFLWVQAPCSMWSFFVFANLQAQEYHLIKYDLAFFNVKIFLSHLSTIYNCSTYSSVLSQHWTAAYERSNIY